MPVNKQGIWTYSDNDVVQSWPIFMNLGFNSVSEVVKGLQDGRVIIAKNDSDREIKLKPMRDVAGKNPDVLIYQADRKTVSVYSDGKYTTIFGGPVETDYIVENSAFAEYRRYVADGSNSRVSKDIRLTKAGLWLISGQITITNDFNANGAYINVIMTIDGKDNNVGVFNTYAHNDNVMFVHMGPIAKYTTAPNQNVSVSVRLSVDQNTNLGWGGLTIQATKIG